MKAGAERGVASARQMAPRLARPPRCGGGQEEPGPHLGPGTCPLLNPELKAKLLKIVIGFVPALILCFPIFTAVSNIHRARGRSIPQMKAALETLGSSLSFPGWGRSGMRCEALALLFS